MITDAQIHVWEVDRPERPWPNPPRNEPHHEGGFSAEQAIAAMDGAGVDRAVIVPPTWSGEDNSPALEAAAAYPGRFAVMGRFNVGAPGAPERLETWLQTPDMIGIRLTFFAEPFSTQVRDGSFDWFWPAAERLGIPVMAQLNGMLEVADRVAAAHPELRLIIDHLAWAAGAPDPFSNMEELIGLAKHENIYVKASGTPSCSNEPYPFSDLDGQLKRVYDAFGSRRMMWGADISRLQCTYEECRLHFSEALPFLTTEDREWIMRKTAAEVLNWRSRPMVNRQANQIRREVLKFRAGSSVERPDVVAAEEPLEIRLQWQSEGRLNLKSIAVTMRTPGDDFELAAGFLYGEGILDGRNDVADVAYCLDTDIDEEQRQNIVTVTLAPGREFELSRLERNFYTTSSCGVCGKATLEALEIQGCELLGPGLEVGFATICSLPQKLRVAQEVFETTGGLHAAGLFSRDGELLALHEDVGRHNAMDKLVGSRFFNDKLPLESSVLLLSGRCSFELVQKALRARIPVVASVGAPSSLAVDVAESFGMTLCGFVRPDGFNVYTGAGRIRS